MKQETKRWLEQAEENYETMQAMWNGHRYSFTCFMAQQTLEAILKAAIIEIKTERHPKIHDLGRLYMQSGLSIREDIRISLEKISPHFWQVRYPDLVRHKYNKERAEKTLKETVRIYKWIKHKITKK